MSDLLNHILEPSRGVMPQLNAGEPQAYKMAVMRQGGEAVAKYLLTELVPELKKFSPESALVLVVLAQELLGEFEGT